VDVIDTARPESGTPRIGTGLSPTAALARFAPPDGSHVRSTQPAQEETRYGFKVADVGFLVGRRTLCEVIPTPLVARIPHTAEWLSGVCNLRGSLVPVFDLRPLLKLAPRASSDAVVIVLDRGEHAAAVLIDGQPRALTGLNALSQLPPLPEALANHVSVGLVAQGSTWLELDHREFFASLRQRMAA
jgi:twitching motility protein PilI